MVGLRGKQLWSAVICGCLATTDDIFELSLYLQLQPLGTYSPLLLLLLHFLSLLLEQRSQQGLRLAFSPVSTTLVYPQPRTPGLLHPTQEYQHASTWPSKLPSLASKPVSSSRLPPLRRDTPESFRFPSLEGRSPPSTNVAKSSTNLSRQCDL